MRAIYGWLYILGREHFVEVVAGERLTRSGVSVEGGNEPLQVVVRDGFVAPEALENNDDVIIVDWGSIVLLDCFETLYVAN